MNYPHLLLAIASHLRRLVNKEIDPKHWEYGICSEVLRCRRSSPTLLQSIKFDFDLAIKSWPEFSGYTEFPLPSFDPQLTPHWPISRGAISGMLPPPMVRLALGSAFTSPMNLRPLPMNSRDWAQVILSIAALIIYFVVIWAIHRLTRPKPIETPDGKVPNPPW